MMNKRFNEILDELPDGCVIHKTGDLYCYYEDESGFNKVALMSRQNHYEPFEEWMKRVAEFRKNKLSIKPEYNEEE